MKSLRVLYHMVRADFLERARRYSFLVTLAAALYLAYAAATEKLSIIIGSGYRGVYNSAWIGALMAVCCSVFLSLAGFYVVKNSIQRDVDTRVGQVLAATPMSRAFYMLAKALSNFAVLASMLLVLMAAGLAMQLLHPESGRLSLWELWSPFLMLAIPAIMVTASLAVLFESVHPLRGGLGNVLYFFLWIGLFSVGVSSHTTEPAGVEVLFDSMFSGLHAIDPTQPRNSSFTVGGERAIHTFYWSGVHWTSTTILDRLLWVPVSVGVALLAALFFHRFDPARERRRWATKPAANMGALGASDLVSTEDLVTAETPVANRPLTYSPAGGGQALSRPPIGRGEHLTVAAPQIQLTRLVQGQSKSRFFGLVNSELRLMLKGLRWWWYAVAAGLLIASLASPSHAQGPLLAAAWIWPVLVWSQMGSREAHNRTAMLIFSSPRALYRQLPAVWVSGVVVAVFTGGGVALRLLIGANWPQLAAWFAGALFIPCLALALGVWSGSSKAFEALYTVWWYIGPAHQTPGLDFMGTTPASSNAAYYLLLSAALLIATYYGRRTKIVYP